MLFCRWPLTAATRWQRKSGDGVHADPRLHLEVAKRLLDQEDKEGEESSSVWRMCFAEESSSVWRMCFGLFELDGFIF